MDVELDGIKDRHPFNEEICLKAVENKDLFYKVLRMPGTPLEMKFRIWLLYVLISGLHQQVCI